MKKRLLFIVFCLLGLTSASFSQISFGPKLGVAFSKFDDIKRPSDQPSFDYSFIIVPQVGVVLNAQFGDHFALRPELLYTQRGSVAKASEDFFGDTYNYKGTIRVSYMELPINFVGSLKAGPGNVELFVGPSFAYLLGGKFHQNVTGPNLDQSKDGKVVGKKQPSNYNDPGNNDDNTYFNPINVSLNFGLSYRFDNGLLIQGGYNLGLSNLSPHFENSKEEDDRNKTVVKSNAITLGVAYLFGGK